MSLWLSLETDACEHCGRTGDCVLDRNITHNLTEMADEAGLYMPLWRPYEIEGVSKAGDLIPMLERGLRLLESDRERFEKFNPPNGWGGYDGLVDFAREFLEACREYPDARVRACR